MDFIFSGGEAMRMPSIRRTPSIVVELGANFMIE